MPYQRVQRLLGVSVQISFIFMENGADETHWAIEVCGKQRDVGNCQFHSFFHNFVLQKCRQLQQHVE